MRYSLESPGNYGWGSLDSGGTINQKEGVSRQPVWLILYILKTRELRLMCAFLKRIKKITRHYEPIWIKVYHHFWGHLLVLPHIPSCSKIPVFLWITTSLNSSGWTWKFFSAFPTQRIHLATVISSCSGMNRDFNTRISSGSIRKEVFFSNGIVRWIECKPGALVVKPDWESLPDIKPAH